MFFFHITEKIYGLLGNPSDIGAHDKEIDQIIEELNINDGPSTKEEATKQNVRSQRVKHAQKTISLLKY